MVDLTESRGSNVHRFLESAFAGDETSLRACLGQGVPVNSRGKHGKTALHLACHMDHASVVETLIGAGAELEATDEEGLFPLLIADDPEIVRMLIAAGADPNRAAHVNEDAPSGMTPLLAACSSKHPDTLRTLLDHGARLDVLGHDGSPLFTAASAGNSAALEILLDAGVDVGERSSAGRTALMEATLYRGERAEGALQCVDILLRAGVDVNAVDNNGDTALTLAAFWGLSGPIVQRLIDAGADVNAVDRPLLSRAILLKQVDVVRAFVAAGIRQENLDAVLDQLVPNPGEMGEEFHRDFDTALHRWRREHPPIKEIREILLSAGLISD